MAKNITIVTYDWVPEFPRGFVRDIRVRWAANEARIAYDVETVPFKEKSGLHREMQPFEQVPILKAGNLSLFESGAILLYLAEKTEALMPRDEEGRASDIPLTNFRGIELRDFPAEIARLALIIAEYQCDVLYRGQKDALAEFLPLNADNWITCGNALRLDWLSVCPPNGTGVKLQQTIKKSFGSLPLRM